MNLVGLHRTILQVKGGPVLTAREAIEGLGRHDISWSISGKENSERCKHGMLTGALHAPYPADR